LVMAAPCCAALVTRHNAKPDEDDLENSWHVLRPTPWGVTPLEGQPRRNS